MLQEAFEGLRKSCTLERLITCCGHMWKASVWVLTACVVIAQTGAGVSGLRPAAAVECQGVGSQLRFMRPAERQATGRLPSGSMEDADGSAAVPRIPLAIVFDAELHALVTSCCVETLWPLPGAIADLQKALAPARRAPAAPPRLTAADRWKSAARSATNRRRSKFMFAPEAIATRPRSLFGDGFLATYFFKPASAKAPACCSL